ncbi:hypothetical protein Vau01_125110 [Virgisporangium aurantiacum]|uniref:Uncharacterized protein n=1 Tax=Virgisporangium aurantiacum TaxID=175570 RepID=A0A8J3ZN42_9ACTN|nr:hypothetical protein Vau01_125110 [Virgisporangium aurantiacum]
MRESPMTKISDLDPAQTATVLAKQLNGRPLTSLPAVELKRLTDGLMGAWSSAVGETSRRKGMPRGRAKLRLVADQGLLTQSGRNAIRAAKARRTREARRSAES